jgi:hypothetical protein
MIRWYRLKIERNIVRIDGWNIMNFKGGGLEVMHKKANIKDTNGVN